MENTLKLYMIMIGCTPPGRLTEQHDVLFAIGSSMKETIPQLKAFWPDGGELHVDAWREVTSVDGYSIKVMARDTVLNNSERLFFINLGGYKQDEFDEFHYKMVVVASSLSEATKASKQTAFYKHTGFKGATSHIDDKYGIDIDDVYNVEDILPAQLKSQYQLAITKSETALPDQINLGYFRLNKLT